MATISSLLCNSFAHNNWDFNWSAQELNSLLDFIYFFSFATLQINIRYFRYVKSEFPKFYVSFFLLFLEYLMAFFKNPFTTKLHHFLQNNQVFNCKKKEIIVLIGTLIFWKKYLKTNYNNNLSSYFIITCILKVLSIYSLQSLSIFMITE